MSIAEARLVAGEAELLARLRDSRGHERLGFHFGNFTRELLGIDPRTARNRVALHRILSSHPIVRSEFLAGQLSACQVLALRSVLTSDEEALWVKRAAGCTVAEIRDRVREARGAPDDVATATEDADDDAPMRTLSFDASPIAALAWEQALETARKVLGWEAPTYQCVEAILAEAAPDACPDEPPGLPSRRAGTRVKGTAVRGRTIVTAEEGQGIAADSVRRARQTLRHVAEMLGDLDEMLQGGGCEVPGTGAGGEAGGSGTAAPDRGSGAGGPGTAARGPGSGAGGPGIAAHEILDRLRNLQVLGRPLRVYLGRLLGHLRETGALYRRGYLSLEEFGADHLHLSTRATRDLLRQSEVFHDRPELEAAFASSRIGLGQALLIERFALRPLEGEFIARAEQVTFRQFRREVRLLEKFSDLGLGRFMRALPRPGLIADLVRELILRGWPAADVARQLASGGFDAIARWIRGGRRGRCPWDDTDPAETSIAPIEILVDLLVLATFDPDDPRTSEVRQTFSAEGGADLQGGADGDERADGEAVASLRRVRTIRFRAPEPVARHWYGALRQVRSERGLLPSWACVMILLKSAVDVWTSHDPEATPVRRQILERDGYLCQVPGCTSRRNLEVHHIEFRSRGGTDHRRNRTTLCDAHHRHMLHHGFIRLSGQAPHGLVWEMGRRPGRKPVWRLRGEKFSR